MQMLLYCVYIKRGSEAASLALRLFSKLWRAPLFFFSGRNQYLQYLLAGVMSMLVTIGIFEEKIYVCVCI